MDFQKTSLEGMWLIKPQVLQDDRGFFLESYSEQKFKDFGIDARFVQDNHSMSTQKGVLRGLHFQKPPHAQAKLVRVVRGAVFDVVVDLRKNSETFGKWEGFELSGNNFKMLFVPRGFAHGFCTLENNTEFVYKVDNFYEPKSEGGIVWNDPNLKIQWSIKSPILSDKDSDLPKLADIESPF